MRFYAQEAMMGMMCSGSFAGVIGSNIFVSACSRQVGQMGEDDGQKNRPGSPVSLAFPVALR